MADAKQSRMKALAPLGRVARAVLYRVGLADHARQLLWRVTGRGEASRAVRSMRIDFYSKLISPGDLVYDIGANFGDYTEVFSALGGNVLAIEPQPYCFERLVQRFRLARRVSVEQVAVAAAPGTIEMHAPADGSVIATASQKWMHEGRFATSDWTRHFKVKAVTLDDLIARHGVPKFIKIDVEGFEGQALAGLSRAIESVSFEFAREFIADTAECIATLGRLGDYRFNFASEEDKQFSHDEWMTGEAMLAQLNAMPSDGWGDVYARLRSR